MLKTKTKKTSKQDKKKVFLDLHPETKKSIFAIILLATSFIFVLSGFNKAGIFGQYLVKVSRYFFGVGFWFFPLIIFLLALVFFISEREKRIYFTTLVGGAILFESFLAILETFFKGKAGLLGKIGALLEKIFGFYGSLIFWLSAFVVGILISFNIPLKIKLKKREKKEPLELSEKEQKAIPEQPEAKEKQEPLEQEPEQDSPKSEKDKPQEKENIFKAQISKLNKRFSSQNKILPPLSLLEQDSSKPKSGDLKIEANIIKRTLANFGIFVELAEVNVGPTVTRYTFSPAEGTRLSRILALSNELSLALAAHPIRIEAPIPGKSLIGIEVPNKAIAIVRLKNLIEKEEFQKGPSLLIALGRDVAGKPIYVDLAKMPHLLIAGATGSGKSITIHSLLCSLLFKNTPADLNLILIDPKKVELTLYQDLPHLITPTIIEAKKAIAALHWLINEMDNRYDLLLEEKVRDLESYNKVKQKKGEEKKPYIVAVIDELADLMTTYPREMEAVIVRLAQMARATGIHLVVSTQRPSVEVITGLIKANIPSRVALQVASQIDSRTILDMAGAEKLLGRGDMLFINAEMSKPKRIQGVYISTKEVKRLVDFWKKSNLNPAENETQEIEKIEKPHYEIDFEKISSQEDDDPLYEDAYNIVVQAQKASASYLQRRLKIGYARAARLLDILEERGVIGPSQGAKPREVYIKPEE